MAKIRYSPLELRLLEIMPKDGRKISTTELAGQVYAPGEEPINARLSVLGAMNKLILKSDENEEEWEIFKSRRAGSQPAYFWLTSREK